ncbi:transcription regulator [Vigna unguiculata]|uniref:Transcription regulator n=1 Tax=Vigna unguiculata TaxID=3917 RepID=A0A4D6LTW0_VIGUN|nr:transcription regulator [Vigna unguiculata]
MVYNHSKSLRNGNKLIPIPPTMSRRISINSSCECKISNNSKSRRQNNNDSSSKKDLWERLFHQGYKADVCINTNSGGVVYAHSNIIAMASSVLRGMLKQAHRYGRWRIISIIGVPHDAVQVFIRYLYTYSYEKEDMDEFVLHLLVLSHVYMVPHLKCECEQKLELGLLTIDNLVDVFQLALFCDAPRLSLICHRKILKNFKVVSESEGWKTMKLSHPLLEKEILESMIDEENMKKERIRKMNDKKVYLQLYEAMEALVHICRDGCRTIGPHDKDLRSYTLDYVLIQTIVEFLYAETWGLSIVTAGCDGTIKTFHNFGLPIRL